MTKYRSSPRSMAHALERFSSGLAPATVLAEAQAAWTEAVGEAIAAEAQPTSERAGVLTVSCSASVWAQELDLMAPVILERLNASVRRGEITRLRCVTVPAREPGQRW